MQALEFNFQSPDSVNTEEEFSVSISLQEESVYDVKIFVHNSEDDKITQKEIISEIKNSDGWKSSWNYIISAFPDAKSFTIKVTAYADKSKICLRLRKSGAASFSEKCSDIEIKNNEENSENELNQNADNKIQEQTTDNNRLIEEVIENFSNKQKISLNSKKQILETNNSLITKEEKLRIYLIYAFSFFCLIIILLLGLRKL